MGAGCVDGVVYVGVPPTDDIIGPCYRRNPVDENIIFNQWLKATRHVACCLLEMCGDVCYLLVT